MSIAVEVRSEPNRQRDVTLHLDLDTRSAYVEKWSPLQAPEDPAVLRWPLRGLGSPGELTNLLGQIVEAGVLDDIAAAYRRDYDARGVFGWVGTSDADRPLQHLEEFIGRATAR